MTSNGANITLGTPVLLSGNESKLDFKPLSRVGIGNNGTANFQESLLQELIDQRPGILPICDFCPGVANIFFLGREIPVDTGGGQGFIDNLLVTDDGRLVLVETKLWRNPEALREVVAQTLQYGMAVSRLSASELDDQLRRADPKWRRLGQDETAVQYVRNLAESDSLLELDDDFEHRSDELRRAGEILLLVVGDGIRPGVERLIQWINATFGYAPCKFGLIELRLYDLPDVGRVVVPKTLLRTREASRQVVSINLQSAARDLVTVSVRGGPDVPTTEPKTPHADVPVTEEAMTELIRAKNLPEIAEIAEQLRDRLRSSGLTTKYCPTEILYGVEIEGDLISLVHVCTKYVYVLLPIRAVRALGEERFVECKRKINTVAEFYSASTVEDPSKNASWSQKYGGLNGRIGAFMKAVAEIAETIRSAMTVA
jgi:hypothetical protein